MRNATVRFRLFKAHTDAPSTPPFHEHYLELARKREGGELTGKDPFPEDMKALFDECVADEEDRLGRPLTEHERATLLHDPEDDDGA